MVVVTHACNMFGRTCARGVVRWAGTEANDDKPVGPLQPGSDRLCGMAERCAFRWCFGAVLYICK